LALVAAGAFAGARATGLDQLPDVQSLTANPFPSDTLVYDRSGTVLLADLHSALGEHVDVPLGAMGRWLPSATVALDDPDYWSRPRIATPGSPITLRLVRLRLDEGRGGPMGRLRQGILAADVSAAYSKDQILEMYLNRLPYGNGVYGPQSAAHGYFGVDASRLDLAQAALLAGLPASPGLYDPRRDGSLAKRRQGQVLDAMVHGRAISRQQADAAAAEAIQLAGPSAQVLRAPAFVAQVRDALLSRFGPGGLNRGLRVVTTLDWGLQEQAERSMADAVHASSQRNVTNGALAALDPRSGELLAVVGAADARAPGGQYDFSASVPRSPGTAFSLFTYTAAIASRRYTMVTSVSDAPIEVQMPDKAGYRPHNFDLRYHGACDLQACLGGSLVVPTVQVELGTGLTDVVLGARAMGAPPYFPRVDANGSVRYTTDDPPDRFGPALTAGSYGETPLQMATAASVLANAGVLHEPHSILSVRSSSGRALYRSDPGARRQVLDPGVAFIVSQMLSDDANRESTYGRDSPLVLPGRRAAAEPGTAEALTDAWTVGYTPSLATAVWMGNSGFQRMAPGSDAVFVAAPAWHQFMQAALDQMRKGDEWYTPPPGLESSLVNGRLAYFLPGTSPSTPAPTLPDSVRPASG
jgi:membrane peptidoglycan carboxypeptidase